MSAELGPVSDDTSIGWPERIAGTMLGAWLSGVEFGDFRCRFHTERARLSIHGESNKPRDGFSRGVLLTMLLTANILFAVTPMFVFELLREVIWSGFAFGVPVAGLFALTVALGSLNLMTDASVIDHTTEPDPEALADLQARFVDGDLDEGELAEEVERVIDR